MKKQPNLTECSFLCSGWSTFTDAFGITHAYCAWKHREIILEGENRDLVGKQFVPGTMMYVMGTKLFPDWCPFEEAASPEGIPHMDGKPYEVHPTCVDTDSCGHGLPPADGKLSGIVGGI